MEISPGNGVREVGRPRSRKGHLGRGVEDQSQRSGSQAGAVRNRRDSLNRPKVNHRVLTFGISMNRWKYSGGLQNTENKRVLVLPTLAAKLLSSVCRWINKYESNDGGE